MSENDCFLAAKTQVKIQSREWVWSWRRWKRKQCWQEMASARQCVLSCLCFDCTKKKEVCRSKFGVWLLQKPLWKLIKIIVSVCGVDNLLYTKLITKGVLCFDESIHPWRLDIVLHLPFYWLVFVILCYLILSRLFYPKMVRTVDFNDIPKFWAPDESLKFSP